MDKHILNAKKSRKDRRSIVVKQCFSVLVFSLPVGEGGQGMGWGVVSVVRNRQPVASCECRDSSLNSQVQFYC